MQCPRCSGDFASMVSKANDGSGAWELYLCSRCNYGWRSTEDEDVRDADKMDPEWKLSEELLESMGVR